VRGRVGGDTVEHLDLAHDELRLRIFVGVADPLAVDPLSCSIAGFSIESDPFGSRNFYRLDQLYVEFRFQSSLTLLVLAVGAQSVHDPVR
jgi:hypothetical protein